MELIRLKGSLNCESVARLCAAKVSAAADNLLAANVSALSASGEPPALAPEFKLPREFALWWSNGRRVLDSGP